jgi:glutathione S-transferase
MFASRRSIPARAHDTMPILYTTPLSANGRKPIAVGLHLSIDLDVRSVNVYRGEGNVEWYRKLNPWGKVPTLVDAELCLWESNAIMLYLSEALGNYALSSRDPKQRADIARWMFWESSRWQPVMTDLLRDVCTHRLFPDRVPEPRPVDWDREEAVSLLRVLEATLRSQDYLSGGALSLADFAVAGMTTYFEVGQFPERKYPAFDGWLQRINALPSWAATAVSPWRTLPKP